MSFKMIGNFKYNLDKEFYEHGNDTLEIIQEEDKWTAVFTIEGIKTSISEKTYEKLDIAMDNFCYSLKSNEEIIKSYPIPPSAEEITKNFKNIISLYDNQEIEKPIPPKMEVIKETYSIK